MGRVGVKLAYVGVQEMSTTPRQFHSHPVGGCMLSFTKYDLDRRRRVGTGATGFQIGQDRGVSAVVRSQMATMYSGELVTGDVC